LTPNAPDNVLVVRALHGHGDSFTELCRRHYGAMVAIGHAILGDRHLAEDAAQEAFAKAAVRLSRLRRPDQFDRWVAAICRNEARSLARTRRRVPLDGKGSVARSGAGSDEACEAVRDALRRLPLKAREVIFLRFYDGLSYEQISAVLGISEQAINGRLRRAKRKLANHLRRAGFGEVRI
jgi:RNA polymerase sigma-70 factor (ECF subfamily)